MAPGGPDKDMLKFRIVKQPSSTVRAYVGALDLTVGCFLISEPQFVD
jgi:hypothetical protein